MARDLKFAWEETPQQLLDEQKQKVRESLHAALIAWAQHAGEGSDYTDNLPLQCLHPTGHWYEIPNMLRNGVLAAIACGAAGLAVPDGAQHRHARRECGSGVCSAGTSSRARRSASKSSRASSKTAAAAWPGSTGGRGWWRAWRCLPRKSNASLSYYNSATAWIHLDRLLDVFGLTRQDLSRFSQSRRPRPGRGRPHAHLHHFKGCEEALGQRARKTCFRWRNSRNSGEI